MDGWPPACSSAFVLLPARMTTTARTNFCHQGPLSLKVDGRLSELWIMVMRMSTTTMRTTSPIRPLHGRVVLGTMGRSRRGTRRFADVCGGLIELMQAAGTCAAATRDTGPAYLDTTVALRDPSTAGTTNVTTNIRPHSIRRYPKGNRRYRTTNICRAHFRRNTPTNRRCGIDTIRRHETNSAKRDQIVYPTFLFFC